MISKKLGLFVSLVLLALGMQAKAAVLDVQGTINVTIDGGVTTQAGNIDVLGTTANGADDWALNTIPANTNNSMTIFKFAEFPAGTITGLELYESDGTFVKSAAVTLQAILEGTKSYVLRVLGTAGSSYVVNLSSVSTVPLPAAAVLFLSALAGFGMLSRRRGGLGSALTA